ncbi:MAG: RNA methyltransferase [Bacteroidetes bacterium]|nr:RNA methyltransferase [Bacteroidota bacterium]
MISKAEIKQLRQLRQKKFRDEQKLFIAETPKVVNELLQSPFKLKQLFATCEFPVPSSVSATEITQQELEKISLLTSPNQVLGVFEMHTEKFPPLSLLASELALALDDIRDPGNMGTIIRIADWFGIQTIFCSENCVDVYNPKVVQANMGSMARVKVHYAELKYFLEETKQNPEFRIYGAVMNGKNIYTEKLSSNGIILIGNESKGVSEELLPFVTEKISIPNFGKADSLNAAVAAAIICSEFKRR